MPAEMFLKIPLSAFLVIVLVFGVYFEVSSMKINATSSELYRPRRQAQCKSSEYQCDNGECISSYDKCDGTKHCTDGSDETSAVCKGPGIECPLMTFECNYGACIYQGLRCDGEENCVDGSDEKGCRRPPDSTSPLTPLSSCRYSQFTCRDGQCINGYDICDGVKHCSDGSDETTDVCSDYDCLLGSFKCSYGACLDPTLKCNGKEDCHDGSDERGDCLKPPPQSPDPLINRPTYTPVRPLATQSPVPSASSCKLPPQPKNGVYNSQSMQCSSNNPPAACRNTPGLYVPSTWLLKYTCNSGYSLNKDSSHSICENGAWLTPLECIKHCPPLTSQSVNVQCSYGGAEIDCSLSMKPDTRAIATCKPHYTHASLPEYSSLACLENGEWSYPLFYCTPECGLSSKEDKRNPQPLILNGTSTKLGEFPWLAAIYRKSGRYWDQQCGGTLITAHVIVTAAHCLVNNNVENNKLAATDIKVGLGKYQRNYYNKEGLIADVKEVVIPLQFVGQASNYAQDIGLLDLVESVQVTATIMPACVDWSTAFVPDRDAEGVVAGWGRTGEGGTSSEVVLSARLKLVAYNECLKTIPAGQKSFLTHDKFCGGNVDGSEVMQGDSGGGVTFLKDGKHFLIGIVSTRFTTFSTFLDLTNKEHSTWLEKEKNRLRLSHRAS